MAPSQITSKLPGISRVSNCKKRTTSGPLYEWSWVCIKSLPSGVMPPITDQMVTAQFDAQGGRLSPWCIRANCHWQQVKRGLNYEDDGAHFGLALFFSSSIP